jgi:hypothetical protein
VILFLLLATTAEADVAQVIALKGEVFAPNLVTQGEMIDEGQTIITLDRSFAVLQFSDGSKVTIRPNSELTIERYSYLDGEDTVMLDLVGGGLRVITGAIAKTDPEAYKVNTPVVLMGVRGTEFSVQLVDE